MVVCCDALLVGLEHLLGPAHQPRAGRGRRPTGRVRVHAGEEAELGACTCCRCPARLRWSSSASPIGALRVGEQPAQRLVLVPVGAEQVGAEVADDRVLVVRGRPPR